MKSTTGFGYTYTVKFSRLYTEETDVVASNTFKKPLDKKLSSESVLLFTINSPTEKVMDELLGALNVATLPINWLFILWAFVKNEKKRQFIANNILAKKQVWVFRYGRNVLS